jgi:hypothetical protein
MVLALHPCFFTMSRATTLGSFLGRGVRPAWWAEADEEAKDARSLPRLESDDAAEPGAPEEALEPGEGANSPKSLSRPSSVPASSDIYSFSWEMLKPTIRFDARSTLIAQSA